MKVAICLVLCFAVVFAEEKNDCHERRVEALKNPHPMKIIPNCKANGDYEGLQCHNERFCQCWRPDGVPINMPSNSIRFCDCLLERDQHEHSGAIGVFKPSCQATGKFQSKQCWPSTGMCWCADQDSGKQITEPTHGEVNC